MGKRVSRWGDRNVLSGFWVDLGRLERAVKKGITLSLFVDGVTEMCRVVFGWIWQGWEELWEGNASFSGDGVTEMCQVRFGWV